MQIDSKTSDRIENRSEPLEVAVLSIVKRHTADLEQVITQLKSLLHDDTPELSDKEIDTIMLELPLLLFDITDDQEIVGMQSDFASQLYKESYNEAYKIAKGTVAERQTSAELDSMIQKLDSMIYDRAYKIIKQKVSLALEALNAVKKVQSSRQQRNDLSRYTTRL